MKEALISINGETLTEGQSMAVRVAVSSFYSDMMRAGKLGSDALGESLRIGYRDRIREVENIIRTGDESR